MDYFDYNARRTGAVTGIRRAVVEFDRNVDDTARILRNERGEAAGFVVEPEQQAQRRCNSCLTFCGTSCKCGATR